MNQSLNTRHRSVEILLVEGRPTSMYLPHKALEKAKPLSQIHLIQDGLTAWDSLYIKGIYAAGDML